MIKATKGPLLAALLILAVITLLLATVLHFTEFEAGTEGFNNWWDSLWWVLLYYIGNPGAVVHFNPVTGIGNAVAILCGIVQIGLFAIVTGYFIRILSEALRSIRLADCEMRILKHLRRRKSKVFPHKVVRPYVPVVSIQAQEGIAEDDIIDAVNGSSELRLRNLADAQMRAFRPNDRLVAERVPKKNKGYGCCINRQSKVTIVCPTAISEAGIGNFSWYVAQMGGFNYVSREVRLPEEEDITYYHVTEENTYAKEFCQFIDDIFCLSPDRNHWVIIMIASVDSSQMCHFVYGTEKGKADLSQPEVTAKDINTLDGLMKGIETAFRQHGVKCERAGRGSAPSCLEYKLGEKTETLTLRLSYETMLWANCRMLYAEDLVKAIAAALGLTLPTYSQWSSEEAGGYGYRKQK